MDVPVLLIFGFVYLGMILGRIPGLALDRTGVALVGAVAMLALGRVGTHDAWLAVDVPTIGLLLGLMVISAQFRLAGFYTALTRRVAAMAVSPPALLAVLIALVGGLSAVLGNDIICLAVTPILVEACSRRRLDPVPFLLALACASNIGSAATLIGNPQNILIGQTLRLSFNAYLGLAATPSLLGLAALWAILVWQARGRWHGETPMPQVDAPPFDRWQASKASAVVLALIGAFLFTDWPRDVVALAAAGLLLMSRRMHSQKMLGLVDWQLLVLFVGLFVVNHVVITSGMLESALTAIRGNGIDPAQPATMFTLTVVLSNLVSNVPAVMLMLPLIDAGGESVARAGAILALASTLAGNLFIVGSIANIIVVDQARPLGVRIGWRRHAQTGVPVTVATLVIAAAWLWWMGAPR
jgi:Na+/H+ antiporter NhaD/arsenite permease-like protein